MKRGGEVVVLALVLTLLCLALGGLGCKEPEKTKVAKCKYVVGSFASERMGSVTVQLCKMPDGRCYYVSSGGTILKTRCVEHIFAGVTP